MLNFLSISTAIRNYVKHFFKIHRQSELINIALVWKHFCKRVCPSLNFTVTVNKFSKTVSETEFWDQMKQIVIRYKKKKRET